MAGRKMGRPPRSGEAAVSRGIRATEQEWAAWDDKAARAGMSRNELVRAACDAYTPPETTMATITRNDIDDLRREAYDAGDLRMAMICDLAIGGPDVLDGAEPGTEAARLAAEGRTQQWARSECARSIAAAAAAGEA